jgi:hypothetical protein
MWIVYILKREKVASTIIWVNQRPDTEIVMAAEYEIHVLPQLLELAGT